MLAAPVAAVVAEATTVVVRNLTRGTLLAREVEVAGSFWARFRGLMGRRAIAPGTGLYLPGNGIHMFFMRFAIDAVFLSRPGPAGERQVVGLRPGLRPWLGLVPYVRGAAGVLELPAGTVEATGTAVGDVVVLEGLEQAGPPDRGRSPNRTPRAEKGSGEPVGS